VEGGAGSTWEPALFFRKPKIFWEFFRIPENISEILKIFQKFWKYFRNSEIFSENLKIFQEFWKILRIPEIEICWLRRQRDWSPTCANMIPRREHAVRAFTDAFYNCVSTGHQIKNMGHKLKLADWPGGCGPPVAEHKARATAIRPRTMERSARRECAVLEGKMKTYDWLCCCNLCVFLDLPISAILVC